MDYWFLLPVCHKQQSEYEELLLNMYLVLVKNTFYTVDDKYKQNLQHRFLSTFNWVIFDYLDNFSLHVFKYKKDQNF